MKKWIPIVIVCGSCFGFCIFIAEKTAEPWAKKKGVFVPLPVAHDVASDEPAVDTSTNGGRGRYVPPPAPPIEGEGSATPVAPSEQVAQPRDESASNKFLEALNANPTEALLGIHANRQAEAYEV